MQYMDEGLFEAACEQTLVTFLFIYFFDNKHLRRMDSVLRRGRPLEGSQSIRDNVASGTERCTITTATLSR